MGKRLFGLWIDGSAAGDLEWLGKYIQQNGIMYLTVCALVQENGAWDFHVADYLRPLLPQGGELEYRPFATDENFQWQRMNGGAWVKWQLAHLEGRDFRVTWCNEPAFRGTELTAWLNAGRDVMQDSFAAGLKVGMGGIQSRIYEAKNQNPDRIDGGKWDGWLKDAGQIGYPTVQIDYTEYTQYFLQAGVYDTTFLDNVVDDRDLLSLSGNWALPKQTYDYPYQNRELLRYRWWNLRAQEIAVPEHICYIREGWHDWAHMANSQRAKDLNGGKNPYGVNSRSKLASWKYYGRDYESTLAAEVSYLMDCYRMDKNVKAAAAYQWGVGKGDKDLYAWNSHTDALDYIAKHENEVSATVPTTPTNPPPVVVDDAPMQPTITLYVEPIENFDSAYINVRKFPSASAPLVGIIKAKNVDVYTNALLAPQLGKNDAWLPVWTVGGFMGYAAAWLLTVSVIHSIPDDTQADEKLKQVLIEVRQVEQAAKELQTALISVGGWADAIAAALKEIK